MTASGREIQPGFLTGNGADSAWILPRARERASRPDPLTAAADCNVSDRRRATARPAAVSSSRAIQGMATA